MTRGWQVLAALVGGIALVATSVAVGVWLTGRQTADVAMPPADASPTQVVRAYVDALNAHDCATAAALRSPEGDSRQLGRLWCRDVQHLRHLHVDRPFDVNGRTAEVPVTFDLTWRPFHDDGSMQEGFTGWGYELLRTSDGGAWRISGEGQG